jgi:hypothetical protein
MTALPASRGPARPGTIYGDHPVAACGNWQLAQAVAARLRLVINIPIRHLLPSKSQSHQLSGVRAKEGKASLDGSPAEC